MRPALFRSTLFNINFFALTAFLSLAYIPALLLPRRTFVKLVRFWLRCVWLLEVGILGLRYEVRGREHLPTNGPYIIACKHQSEYETLKAHLLFDDPAIILKKELLRIPFFGSYLKKAGVLAIDRSTPEKALRSIQNGALEIKAQGRPLLIFPQGTRVKPSDTTLDKPYKPGVARVQDVTGLPIIPVALNSGLFWPKNSWLKSPGTVIFEIMPPIAPGMDRQALMGVLEDRIETRSHALTEEARAKAAKSVSITHRLLLIAGIAFILMSGYALWWGWAAQLINKQYDAFSTLRPEGYVSTPLDINSFPAMHIVRRDEFFLNRQGSLRLSDIDIRGWPIPFVSTSMNTGPLEIKDTEWNEPLRFERFEGVFTSTVNGVQFRTARLLRPDFRIEAEGFVDLSGPIPQLTGVLRLHDHAVFIETLINMGIVKRNPGQFAIAALQALADPHGIVVIPISQRGRTIYAGPFPIGEFPEEDRIGEITIERSFQPAPADLPGPSH